MRSSRRIALAAVLVVVAAVNVIILRRMFATLFFAITVAYVLVPLFSRLRRRGFSRWIAGAISTAVAALGALALVLPLFAVLYFRRDRIAATLRVIPETVTIEFAEFSHVVEMRELVEPATEYLTDVAISLAGAAPVIAAKAVVFVFVVFAILIRREELSSALLAPLPDAHHEIALGLHERVRRTLFALYVTQAATGFGTFLIALPVFVVFGYGSPVTLALAAGILQFMPVVGPSVVVLAQMGLPVPAASVRLQRFSSLHYHAKTQGTLDAGAFESTVREFADVADGGADSLVLVDELESITEPGASAKIIAGILEALDENGASAVFVSHLAGEIRETANFEVTVDGIEAVGLVDGELVVNRSPVKDHLARSTPELIVEKLAGESDATFYDRLLEKFE